MTSDPVHDSQDARTPDLAAETETVRGDSPPQSVGETPPGGGANEPPAVTVESLRAELADCQDKLLRARAECANISRRLRQEYAESLKMAAMPLARDLLQVLDSFDRTLQLIETRPADDPVAQGVRLIADQLVKVLGEHGVQRMEVEIGKSFDPARHEAMLQDHQTSHPPGCVTAELGRGYLLHGRVLRAAKVAVAAEKLAADEAAAPRE